MVHRFSEVREGHSGGETPTHVDLAISPDGKQFATCSHDGSLWIWAIDEFEAHEAPSIHEVADGTHASICWKEDLYMGVTTTDIVTNIEKRSLSRISSKTMNVDKTVFLFAMEVNSIDVSENFIAATCSDCTIKKAALQDTSSYEKIEFDGQPLSIAIDPSEKYVAVTSTDGTLSIYPTTGTIRCAHFERLFKSFGDIGPRQTRSQVRWAANGLVLYVAAQGGVKVIKVEEWEMQSYRFKSDELNEETFSGLALSKNEKYLAATTLNGKICVWETSNRKLISTLEHRNKGSLTAVSSIAFDPSNESQLCLADIKEGVCIVYNAIDKKEDYTMGQTSRASEEVSDDEEAVITRPGRNKFLAHEAQESGGNSPAQDFANDDNDENTRMSVDLGAIKRQYGQFDDLEAEIDFRESNFGETHRNTKASFSGPPVITFNPPVVPPYFISGCVPEKTLDGMRHKNRYLKWNRFGLIRYMKNDDGCTIEVEYYDASISSEIIIPNEETRYTMADLSSKAVALANKPKKQGQSSEMLIINVTTWDREKCRWTTTLPANDLVMDILVTDVMVAVLTDQGNIRIFSLEGTQRQLITHPGVITTAAVFGETIAIASPVGGPQWRQNEAEEVVPYYSYEVTTYSMRRRNWHQSTNSLSKQIVLPVGKSGGTILWMGFTNRGSLVTMDSNYCLRLLSPSDLWIPIFDGASLLSSMSDSIWPISLVETPKCEVRYVYCRGSKMPLLELRLMPTTEKWDLPLCDKETEKTKFEAELLQAELKMSLDLAAGDEIQSLVNEHSKALIQLFGLTLKMEREGRAAELTEFAVSTKAVQALVKYAAKQNRGFLVEKITNIASELQDEEDEVIRRMPRPASRATNEQPIPYNDLGPKRVLLRKRDSVSGLSESLFFSKREEGLLDESVEQVTQITDKSSLISQVGLPYSDNSKINPFNKNNDCHGRSSPANSSLFESLDSPWDRKRGREQEVTNNTPRAKQVKLSFDSSNKENNSRSNAYDCWLSQNEDQLKKDFRGEDVDYEKYCTQTFRMLTPAQKKEWKTRAEQV